MGSGNWDTTSYRSTTATRAATGAPAFAHTRSATKAHDSLDPKRINTKPFGKLESRDNADHPEANAILVCFDVTGSNHDRAVEAQKRLPSLMDLLAKYISDPQVAVAANDDYYASGSQAAVQISDFESDNRVDEHIRNIWLVGNGGGNHGESYDLLLYAAGRKTILDSVDKRGKKGYLFMYADEPFFNQVEPDQVLGVYGDVIEKAIPIREMIAEARELYNVFIIWPQGGYIHAREQYLDLFGSESVLTLQDPNLICELIASTVGLFEEKMSVDDVVDDLVSVAGMTKAAATNLVSTSLACIAKDKNVAKTSNRVRAIGSSTSGAERL